MSAVSGGSAQSARCSERRQAMTQRRKGGGLFIGRLGVAWARPCMRACCTWAVRQPARALAPTCQPCLSSLKVGVPLRQLIQLGTQQDVVLCGWGETGECAVWCRPMQLNLPAACRAVPVHTLGSKVNTAVLPACTPRLPVTTISKSRPPSMPSPVCMLCCAPCATYR